MPVLSEIEELWLEQGYQNLSAYDKNRVIIFVAGKRGLTNSHNDITEPMLVEYLRSLKLEILKRHCDDAIVNGFTSKVNGHFYRTNRDDQINLIGQKDELAQDELMDTVLWKTEDAGYVSHTREEWLTIYQEAFAHKKAQLFKYNTLKQRVLDSETDIELTSIRWEEPAITEEPVEEVVPEVESN